MKKNILIIVVAIVIIAIAYIAFKHLFQPEDLRLPVEIQAGGGTSDIAL